MAILHLMLGRTASNQIQQQVTVHSWSAAWCVVAQMVNICRGVQYTTSSPHITALCTQLQTAMIHVVGVVCGAGLLWIAR
jgi:hypothetical protein